MTGQRSDLIRVRRTAKHSNAMLWINDLVLDLKLQLLGRLPRNPVTFERLNQWHAEHRTDLQQCQETEHCRHA